MVGIFFVQAERTQVGRAPFAQAAERVRGLDERSAVVQASVFHVATEAKQMELLHFRLQS
jgi:hypothetical protein